MKNCKAIEALKECDGRINYVRGTKTDRGFDFKRNTADVLWMPDTQLIAFMRAISAAVDCE